MDLLATNCNLEEVLVLSETYSRPSPKSFHDMKLWISTYDALAWALFGDHFHFYKKFLDLWQTLDTPYVAFIKENFPEQICWQIASKIIEESRKIFTTRLHTDVLSLGKSVPLTAYPSSRLYDVIQYVVYERAVLWSTFPQEWRDGGFRTGGASR